MRNTSNRLYPQRFRSLDIARKYGPAVSNASGLSNLALKGYASRTISPKLAHVIDAR